MSESARHEECEAKTGAFETASTSAIVLSRDVRDVDEHAEPVHLEHDLAAEVRQPVVDGVLLRVEVRARRRSPTESAQSFVFVCVSVM